MASVNKRTRNGTTTYLARWRGPDGTQRKRTFRRKSDAERFLVTIEGAMLEGAYVDVNQAKIKFGPWADRWLRSKANLKESTRTRYEGLIRVQLLPHWQNVPLSQIRHADVATWVATLSAQGLAASTVRQAHRVFSLILDHAVLDGRLARNPADKVPLPRVTPREKRFLSHYQVEELAQACPDYSLVILLLSYCGLRFGELAALRVARVDLLRRRLVIAEALTEVAGKVVFGTPKTHQQRSVAIPRSLIDPLSSQVAGKSGDEFVFTSPTGGVLRVNNFRTRAFDPAAAALGHHGLTPHDLRHTAASLAISAGANVKAVQRMLGHASAAMTLDVYADLFEDDLDSVADQMDNARALAPPVRPRAVITDLPKRAAAL